MRQTRCFPLVALLSLALPAPPQPLVAATVQETAAPSDLDALMARVLGNREQSWRALQDYLLTEHERVDVTGPGGTRLYGLRREYMWVARGQVAVRSPVRFNGVRVSEADRKAYEARFLADEASRQERRARGEAAARDDDDGGRDDGGPRFISEIQFLRYKFEPGNYYLVGREALAGRQVLRIEYYPRQLFSDDSEKTEPDSDEERRLNAAFNKVTLVTLWVDPDRHQIVQSTFDNVDFSFLPGRAVVRMDTMQATMRMGQPLERGLGGRDGSPSRPSPGIWLPESLMLRGAATIASGTFTATYERRFSEYRQADVQMRFRIKD